MINLTPSREGNGDGGGGWIWVRPALMSHGKNYPPTSCHTAKGGLVRALLLRGRGGRWGGGGVFQKGIRKAQAGRAELHTGP